MQHTCKKTAISQKDCSGLLDRKKLGLGLQLLRKPNKNIHRRYFQLLAYSSTYAYAFERGCAPGETKITRRREKIRDKF